MVDDKKDPDELPPPLQLSLTAPARGEKSDDGASRDRSGDNGSSASKGTDADEDPEEDDGDGVQGPSDEFAAIDFDTIIRKGVEAKRQNRKIVTVVGLATSGKSFFIKRLQRHLRSRYGAILLQGPAGVGTQEVERTKDILFSRFELFGKPRSPKNFDMYDVPGELFRTLTRQGWSSSGDNLKQLQLFYALFAFTDALIFIGPAFEVLYPQTFLVTDGDLGYSPNERRLRVAATEQFIESLVPMSKAISQLKKKAKLNPRMTEAAARTVVQEAVDAVSALSFDRLMSSQLRNRIPMPALLLLSRADELARNIPPSKRAHYDDDPIHKLLVEHRAHFDHLAALFDMFSADFFTAEQRTGPGDPVFYPDAENYGAEGLLEQWLLPAINVCNRRVGLPYGLQNPRLAARLRGWSDPDFSEALWSRA